MDKGIVKSQEVKLERGGRNPYLDEPVCWATAVAKVTIYSGQAAVEPLVRCRFLPRNLANLTLHWLTKR